MTAPHSVMTLSLLPQLRCSLAPELRQSLRLLQMPLAELLAYVREIERDNPLIELEPAEWLPYSGQRRRGGAGSDADRLDCWAERPESETLEQALLAQIRVSGASGEEKRAAAFLAGSLNEDGYLEPGPEEAAACAGLRLCDIEAGLALLQSLEPAGAGARSLKECLLLQASRDSSAPASVARLIRDHLDDVARGRRKAIARALGIGDEDAERAIRYLRGLNPRPGLAYGRAAIPYAIPEARLCRSETGEGVTVRPRRPFRLTVHPFSSDPGGGGSPAWRDWAAAKRKEAARLDDMLRFRTRAMTEVIAAIAGQQRRFLEEGEAAIRPLKLEQIAAATGFHLSTVSRAVRGKYVETPYGMLPLQVFFSARLENGRGGEASARSVKCRIRQLIAEEDKRSPHTDARLADLLRREGIVVSRRTVAKYREEERLLPSAFRVSTI